MVVKGLGIHSDAKKVERMERAMESPTNFQREKSSGLCLEPMVENLG